jgi:hypothetical protein
MKRNSLTPRTNTTRTWQGQTTTANYSDKLYALEYMSVTAVFIASFCFRKEIRLTFRNPIFLRETTAGSQIQTHTQRGNVPVQGKRKKREKED